MLLFFLLTALLVRLLVPLTEGTWFHASAQAPALIGPADDERDNNENQCRCYEIIHKKYSKAED